jgi:hypothetical protein
VWAILAYPLKSKLNLPYAEALPIYLLPALLPMLLAFSIYRRYLKGTSPYARHLSPQSQVVCATSFAFVVMMQGVTIPRIVRSHKNVWDLVFHIATTAIWLVMSAEYYRHAARKPSPSPGT